MTRSRVWLKRCVGKETCWVKLARSRREINYNVFESVRSSTWMLKSPVMRKSWGKVDMEEIRVWKSSRSWENDAVSRDFADEEGGRQMLKSDSLVWGSLRVAVDISNDLKVVSGDGMRIKGSRMRNDVPPPTTEEVQEEDTGRELLSNVKPWGMESNNWAEVVLGLLSKYLSRTW